MGNISKHICMLVLFISLVFSTFASAGLSISTKDGQLDEINAVLLELETHYGMIKFKEEQYGLTYDGLRKKYSDIVENANPTLKPDDFRQLIVQLGAEFRDGHLNILRQTSHAWTLGIFTAEINGKLYVTGFSKNFFMTGSTYEKPQVGDEIVALNGKPISEWGKEFLPYVTLATYTTRYNRALESILSHGHRMFPALEAGAPATVTFKRSAPNGSGATEYSGLFHWIDTNDYFKAMRYMPPGFVPTKKNSNEYVFGRGSLTSNFKVGLKSLGLATGSITDIGLLLNTKIENAQDRAEAIERAQDLAAENDEETEENAEAAESLTAEEKALSKLEPLTRLEAYTVRYNGKNLGVIRIPDYSPPSFNDVINEIKWLAEIVKVFENTTDGLIIDQLDNGGGYIWYASQLLSLFAHEKELQGVTTDKKLSLSLLNALEAWSKQKDPLAPKKKSSPTAMSDEEFFSENNNFARMFLSQKHIAELRRKYEAGETWSGALPYLGTIDSYTEGSFGRIVGRKGVTYSKKILVLNDSRSGSCGDMVPAVLQANKRAEVFGETSMGLGGPVYRGSQTPGSEMSMRSTLGFQMRSDGLPIENIGVVPNVQRWVTRYDLVSNFKDYATDALETAVALIDGADTTVLNRNQSKRESELAKRLKLADGKDKNFTEAKELFEALRTVSAHGKPLAEITEDYREFFRQIKTKNLTSLTEANWDLLEFPLPMELKSRDMILASQRYRNGVLERFSEMERLPRFANDAELLTLMSVIRSGFREIDSTHVNGCLESLKRAGSKAQTP